MRLLSVNVGHPQPNPWKTMKLTGIDKRPADEALPRELRELAARRTA